MKPRGDWRPSRRGAMAVAVGMALGGSAIAAAPAQGAPPMDMPSTVPAAFTPGANNGQILSTTQVGNTMVVSGSFTSVSPANSSTTMTRNRVFAFDASTGAISSGFAPVVNGNVETVLPGPVANTVYIGGNFTSVNGTAVNRLALLSLTNGARVTGFNVGTGFNAPVEDLEISGGRLFVGGFFNKAQGQTRTGLATLNPTTGALDGYLNIALAGTHNNSGSGRVERTGVLNFDVSPDGSQMVAIGNFRTAGGLPRVQITKISLGAGAASVDPSFNTTGYEPLCYSFAYDTTVRQTSYDPTGAYFVVTATGGGNGTLCDTTTRWETSATGSDVQPSWIAYAGGDSIMGLAVTDKAIFIGGHQRWMNNRLGNDAPGPGAVPRPGLAALDPVTGVPLAWNPGRNPRGAGAYSLFATDAGIWVGSDTEWIGNRQYRRKRIAFFPYAGGRNFASTARPVMQAVRVAGGLPQGASPVLYRVNAGGPALQSLDSGPDWAGDDGNPTTSPLHNDGNNAAGWGPGATVDATVPSTTPVSVFDAERWDPGDTQEMEWHFPVPSGEPVEVRLYFANRYGGTSSPGQRVFNVDLEGARVLSDFDIVVAAGGDQRGTMRSFDIQSDGSVDLVFGHITESPLVNAIEIVRTDVAPPPPTAEDTVSETAFDGTTIGATTPVANGGIAWSQTRGAFVIGGTLYYAKIDGYLYKRAVTRTGYGTESKVDPYHDPAWANVSNGSGGTYDGVNSPLGSQMSNLTGLFYDGSRLYYSLFGQSELHYRSFSADSGIVEPLEGTASSSVSFSDVSGMFLDGNTLYFVRKSSGALYSVSFANGAVTGSPTLVDDPATSGRNWVGRSVFVAPN